MWLSEQRRVEMCKATMVDNPHQPAKIPGRQQGENTVLISTVFFLSSTELKGHGQSIIIGVIQFIDIIKWTIPLLSKRGSDATGFSLIYQHIFDCVVVK